MLPSPPGTTTTAASATNPLAIYFNNNFVIQITISLKTARIFRFARFFFAPLQSHLIDTCAPVCTLLLGTYEGTSVPVQMDCHHRRRLLQREKARKLSGAEPTQRAVAAATAEEMQ